MTNKEKALALIGTFVTGDLEKAKSLLAEEYKQHNLAFGTGREAFIAAVDGLSGLGAASEGTFGGKETTYCDLFRVENGYIAEHWDVMEPLAEKSTWANDNGKF